MTPQSFYVFASPGGKGTHSPETVFHKTEDEAIARSLCALFTKQFSGPNGLPVFEFEAAEAFPEVEQVLMDDALDSLTLYDDPDRFIYDPPPSQITISLATWARRAEKWEEALRARGASGKRAPDASSPERPANTAPEADPNPTTGTGGREMSAEDRKNSALAILLLVAQAYYKLLESAVSMASWVSALDLNLNESYLWAVTALTDLLQNEDLRDFPEKFEPAFPDLYPSTIRDTEWEDEIAPHAEGFLSAVQRYVISKGLHEPEQGSPGWWVIELYRPSVNTSIERANAYNKRMRVACQRMLGGGTAKAASGPASHVSERASTTRESVQDPAAEGAPDNGSRRLGYPAAKRNGVFLSYSHKDEKFLRQLVDHLKPLERAGRVSSWSDLQIRPGSRWFDEIQRALTSSSVAVLLVTKDFLASDFIDQHELGPLLRAAADGGVTILWVLIRDCNWRATPLTSYQWANPTEKPLAQMKAERDTAWVSICNRIVAAADG